MFVSYTHQLQQRSPEDSPQISGNYRDPRGHMSTSMSTHSMKVKIVSEIILNFDVNQHVQEF